jgi:ketosteroid isomerase-like protein
MKNAAIALLLACTFTFAADKPVAKSAAQLRQTELDFAKAFADRNVDKFASFVAENARFTGNGKVTLGKAAVVANWSKMMQNPNLTLTWEPDVVELSAAGDLGYTSGPYQIAVKKADGSTAIERGRFASVWRRSTDGQYRIELDIGNPEQ